ncbi:MAG: alpha-glucosidase/alpha-galactosidase, partial [Planctomycetes bacterium]|nr:alpha-glucosidase/alpha-galactosidase [Planctomycetota bacterium]
MAIKVAMIGAGSLSFTRRLVADLLSVKELQDTEFRFMDIDKRNLDMVTQICRRDIEGNGVKAKIIPTMDRIEAIKGADYVVCTVRHGGLEAFHHDIEIPLKYGIDQCVGDTLCAGGLTYAQRHIPVLLDIAHEIEEFANPNALFMNYANPMAMNTWAVNRYSGVRHLGLCHGVEHGFAQICNVLGVKKEDCDYVCAGINHQTWYIQFNHKGKDMTGKILEAFLKSEHCLQAERVRIDMLKRFGYYSTESNGHLSEYVPWYRKRANETAQWIHLGVWIWGETGGYLRVCTEGRDWFKKEFPQLLKEPAKKFSQENRSTEHFSHIIEAEVTGRLYRGHFNVQNDGIITNLPQGCAVEVPCFVDRLGVHPQVIGDLPLGCAGVLRNSISVQELGMEAAVHGDIDAFKQALMLDPLTGAVCNPEEIWQLGDELISATAKWLPQYGSKTISAARARLKANPPKYKNATKGVRTEGSVIGAMHTLL